MDYKRILVPVNGEKADDEAIILACNLAKKNKARVHVINIIEVERALPLEAPMVPQQRRAEEILEHAERVAEEEADYQVDTGLLQAREAGPAIVDEAVNRGIDLIVMGFSYKKRFGQFSLGNTMPYVLRGAPCRVLVSRDPMPARVEMAGRTADARFESRLDGSRKFFMVPNKT
ncbi:MAG: universal stress protein [Chloroflexi bacterium]|nr:universal stress protein [Chloroflexota bacterium]